MKRHLLILLAVTLITQAVFFISYPLGSANFDDDQNAALYHIDRLLYGDFLIGNLRYHTGYPLVIAPVVGISHIFGSLDERFVLLVQVSLSALIPFLIYDIFRIRRSPNEALVVALLVALDPFGLQWAHFMLPNWLIALCLVLALWCIHKSLLHPHRWLLWIITCGLVLGVAGLARLNFTPIIAVLGLAFFLLTDLTWMRRFKMFVTLGVSSTAILLLYMLLIHYPSTGTTSFSCYTGINMLVSTYVKDFDLSVENGPDTRHYLELLTLKPPREVPFTRDIYPRWSEPGSWATAEEYAAFINQPYGEPAPQVTSVFPSDLYYYLGPCQTDEILLAVHNEAVQAQPLRWLISIPLDIVNMLIQRREPEINYPIYLPRYDQITFEGDYPLGFRRAEASYYNGQVVWEPGIWFYSRAFDLWNIFKLLLPLAVIWTIWSKDWFYKASAILLIAFLALLSVFGNPSPRLYAPLYPLSPMLIGGFIVFLTNKYRQWRTG